MKRILLIFAKYEEELAISYISFWLCALTLRSIAFFSPRAGQSLLPPLTHLLLASLFLSLSLLFYFLKKPAMFFLLGLGLGILADEIVKNYWSLVNFFSLVFLNASLLFLLWLGSKQEPTSPQPPPKPRENPPNPLVSVVIPAYNEERYIGNALKSLLEQDFQNFEIIVVDNGSEDKTREIARNFGAKVVLEEKKTVGSARQRGVLEAKGEIIAMTDADTILPPYWLSRIVEEFQRDKELVAFGGLYQLYSGPILARLWIRYFAHLLWILDKWLSNGYWNIPGCNLAFRKSAFWKVGGFKTYLRIGEDADLTLRLGKVGKVVLDFRFRVGTSGRRYRKGFLKGTMTYAKNTLGRLLLRKELQTEPPPIREETPPLRKLPLLPFLVIVLYLFSLFSFRCPLLAQKKNLMRKELHRAEIVLAKGVKELKNRLAEVRYHGRHLPHL